MSRSFLSALAIAFATALTSGASAQSRLLSNARVGVGNEHQIVDIDGSSTLSNTHSVYEAGGSYDGLDSTDAPRTMDFYGYAEGNSAFGRLRTYADGYVLNSFYNPSNPAYYNPSTGSVDPSGTPDFLVALAYAGFEDTLQFGGTLQTGYQARYVFHVHGVNSAGEGSDIAAANTLAVSIAGDPYEYRNHLSPGVLDEIWSTKSHAVSGSFAQTVKVDLYSQFFDQAEFYPDGSDIRATADFGSTVTLDGIALVDGAGNVVPTSQWTVSSASGTTYAKLNAVPEPATFVALAAGVLALRRRRR